MAKAMLIDTYKCMACRGCQVACKAWNDLPAETTVNRGTYENPPALSEKTWTRVEFREVEAGGEVAWLFRKHQCMHCTQASCVSVCPTGAAMHHGEFVLIDQAQCIGCGYCVQACPFDAVHLGEPKGTARKCTFCLDRVTDGYEPACAKACPPGAIQFGDRGELIATGKGRVGELRANGHPNARLYGETELGGLHQLYVLTDKAAAFGLPEAPRVATRNVLGQWLSGFVTAGVLAALPFWLVIKRRQEMASSRGGE